MSAPIRPEREHLDAVLLVEAERDRWVPPCARQPDAWFAIAAEERADAAECCEISCRSVVLRACAVDALTCGDRGGVERWGVRAGIDLESMPKADARRRALNRAAENTEMKESASTPPVAERPPTPSPAPPALSVAEGIDHRPPAGFRDATFRHEQAVLTQAPDSLVLDRRNIARLVQWCLTHGGVRPSFLAVIEERAARRQTAPPLLGRGPRP